MNWAKAFHTLISFLESKSQNSVRTPKALIARGLHAAKDKSPLKCGSGRVTYPDVIRLKS